MSIVLFMLKNQLKEAEMAVSTYADSIVRAEKVLATAKKTEADNKRSIVEFKRAIKKLGGTI